MDKDERLCDSIDFPELVESFPAHEAAPDQFEELIEHIVEHASRDTVIALLSRTVPKLLREAVSSRLRELLPDVQLIVGGREFWVHKDVLKSHSKMLAALLSKRWGDKPSIELGEEICSRRSMRQMLSVMYGGEYRLPSRSEWVEEDIHTANYLGILHLLEIHLSDDEIARVDGITE